MRNKKDNEYFDSYRNYIESKGRVGYKLRKKTTQKDYEKIGFMSGLEVHQQLLTDKKLFCNCPAGIFQKNGQYDAELIRHMRPTLSELGEYDGTALMEFKTKKTIYYHVAHATTCTYDVDDTPPFKLNRQALKIALEITRLLKCFVVGELHIARKQYLDGSIPTGFQRTGIIGIEGFLSIRNKKIGIIQISIEEDSCREISDIGHTRIYKTDRLGMPLIEVVTYPDMKTPDEVVEVAQFIRFLTRSTGHVRTGIGSAREDVNVSVRGGTRVEIKGVAKISKIAELAHNEAFRQVSFLEIRKDLLARIPKWENWKIEHKILNGHQVKKFSEQANGFIKKGQQVVMVNLPLFRGILSFFNQPGRMFSDEISDRLKVIACLEKPNMLHSEQWDQEINEYFKTVLKELRAKKEDAQILFCSPQEDIATALEVIEERCKMAFEDTPVPNESRKSLPNGTTIFERVLPGANRMYPDTDTAPIAIGQEFIDSVDRGLPVGIDKRLAQFIKWKVPKDAYIYLLAKNLAPLMERIINDFDLNPQFLSTLFAHRLKHIQGQIKSASPFDFNKLYDVCGFVKRENLSREILSLMLPIVYEFPYMDPESILIEIKYKKHDNESLFSLIPILKTKFNQLNRSRDPNISVCWIMNELRPIAIGNISMAKLAEVVRKEVINE